VAFNAQVIIMDEPTSSLTEEEIAQLFAIIRRLKAAGKGIIYISHKLKEIKEIGDRVTVLKDGEYVGTHNVADVTIDQLVTMMVGRELQSKYHAKSRDHGEQGRPILEVKKLTRRDGYVKDISFTLHQGEILGFSGLVASGRTETMEAVYGAVPVSGGEVLLDGKKLRIRNTYDALNSGIALVTENRRETGFFHNFSIRRNLSIAKQLKDSKLGGLYGLVSPKQEKAISAEQVRAMQIKCATIEQSITELSGGNQQKVILGKWLAAGSRVIIFDEPTKGIDVGTKSEIYKLMRALCEQGVGVIVVSSEMPELLAVCDRILVYFEGRINGEYLTRDATEEKLVYSATVDRKDAQATA
jgi:D-allose transport system ATP-binding protein